MKVEIEIGRDTEVLVRKDSVVIEGSDRESFISSVVSAMICLNLSTEERCNAILDIAGGKDELNNLIEEWKTN